MYVEVCVCYQMYVMYVCWSMYVIRCMYVEVCVYYQMYVMYVCYSMCKLSDVCNVCMLKYV